MKYEAERWKEQEGPSLRNFDETGSTVSGAENGCQSGTPAVTADVRHRRFSVRR